MQGANAVLETRKTGLEDFYKSLIPTLVEFGGRLGVQPALTMWQANSQGAERRLGATATRQVLLTLATSST